MGGPPGGNQHALHTSEPLLKHIPKGRRTFGCSSLDARHCGAETNHSCSSPPRIPAQRNHEIVNDDDCFAAIELRDDL